MMKLERENNNLKTICGIDEAGRGPLFGSMFVAGVVLPKGYNNPEIIDSKKTSKSKRKKLYYEIMNNAIDIFVVEISNKQIDKGNLNDLTKEAILNIIKNVKSDLYIIDWIKVPVENSISLPKAEQSSINVAAASIVAKYYRDMHIVNNSKKYELYDIVNNQGYGTKKHIELIKKYGKSDMHRDSFKLKT